MDPNDYATADLSLAAGLIAAGHALSHIERRSGRAWFCFVPDPTIAATAQQFFAGGLMVDARALTDHLRALKSALHEGGAGR